MGIARDAANKTIFMKGNVTFERFISSIRLCLRYCFSSFMAKEKRSKLGNVLDAIKRRNSEF